MIVFIAGVFVGCFIGLLFAALLFVRKEDDDQ